jgi:hypothetical protein
MKACIKNCLLLSALIAGLGLMVTGCKSVPEGSPALKQQALSFTPPPGMAGVYVIRPWKLASGGTLFNASIDYQVYSSLDLDSYLFGLVPAGLHVINTPHYGIGTVVNASTYFTAEAGSNYFFKIAPAVNGYHINQLSDKDGMAYVREFKLSGDSHFADPAYYNVQECTIPLRNQQTNCPALLVRVSNIKEQGKETIFLPVNLSVFATALQNGLMNTAPLPSADCKMQMNLSFDFEGDSHMGSAVTKAFVTGFLTLGTVGYILPGVYSYQSTVTAEIVGCDGKTRSFSADSRKVDVKYDMNNRAALPQAAVTARMQSYIESMTNLVTQLVQSGIFQGKP